MSDIHRFSVGLFECITLTDGYGTSAATTIFAGAADDNKLREVLNAYNTPYDAVPGWYNPLYINTGQHKVLIDTGNGPATNNPNRGLLRASMKKAGIKPEDIDTVIITHAHGDHILGNTDASGKAAFPNARYIIGQAEWNHWTSEETLMAMGENMVVIRDNLLGIMDKFTYVNDGDEIVPGIKAIASPGHTPGHLALLITSGEAKLFHVADAVHRVIHCEYPDWSPRFDSQPDIATTTRRKLLKMIADEEMLMFGFHFPFPGAGKVTPHGDTWKWIQVT